MLKIVGVVYIGREGEEKHIVVFNFRAIFYFLDILGTDNVKRTQKKNDYDAGLSPISLPPFHPPSLAPPYSTSLTSPK